MHSNIPDEDIWNHLGLCVFLDLVNLENMMCYVLCVPDMKPGHFIDRKERAINDGQSLLGPWKWISAITTESRTIETLSTEHGMLVIQVAEHEARK